MGTKVKFLLDQDDDMQRVFAYFPQLNYDGVKGSEFKMSYAHIGQHSACSTYYADDCKIATKEQYNDLAKELTQLGYDLLILNK